MDRSAQAVIIKACALQMCIRDRSYGMCVVESIRRSCDMVLDVHLMIIEPERYVEAFAKAGARCV